MAVVAIALVISLFMRETGPRASRRAQGASRANVAKVKLSH
jgi:hypothetical protein